MVLAQGDAGRPGGAAVAGASGVDGGSIVETLLSWAPFGVVLGVCVAALLLGHVVLLGGRRRRLSVERRLPRQIGMLALTLVAVIVVVIALPIDHDTRGNLLSLVGLAVTAVLTLSSTTLAANAMAGLMLRATAPFKGGDWVRINEHFGRVTERGLFHTEVQTEDKDLLSLPNLLLATHPVRIVRGSGTIVSAEVSLGYDTPHQTVEPLLLEAADRAGLQRPFVWILALRDHVVEYRVAGLLEDVSGLISVRSRLRASVLDTLHAAGVEIASPSLMIQRRGELDDTIIPRVRPGGPTHAAEPTAERQVFDKAELAAKSADLQALRDELEATLKRLKADRPASEPPDGRPTLDASSEADPQAEIAQIERRLARVKAAQAAAERRANNA
jgi:small-conductance mechanosensitive channel